jgi:hypothetical protein
MSFAREFWVIKWEKTFLIQQAKFLLLLSHQKWEENMKIWCAINKKMLKEIL